MFIAILGRQPDISRAELESVHGSAAVSLITPHIASVDTEHIDLFTLGGTTKIGRVVERLPLPRSSEAQAFISASRAIVQHYHRTWRGVDHKITLGVSAYNWRISPRDVQKTGILLKSVLKKDGVSLRLIPNNELALSTATSHNNKLGLSPSKVELIIIKTDKHIVIAESRGAQNITAYTKRDHGKPKRDAFVGMLPPKLAQIMLNLAVGESTPLPSSQILSESARRSLSSGPVTRSTPKILRSLPQSGPSILGAAPTRSTRGLRSPESTETFEKPNESSRATKSPGQSAARVSPAAYARETLSEAVLDDFGGEDATSAKQITILDPFCGTGTVLQEAALRGFAVYGTDLSEKMIRYTRDNLNWLQDSHRISFDWHIHEADATEAKWRQPIDAVVCETYLGQPFSAPPSPPKLKEVVGNCNHIISRFLTNLHPQLQSGTPLCIAVPSWRGTNGHITHLPLVRQIEKLGYELVRPPLSYSRPDQVVVRELLVLKTMPQTT